MGIAISDLDFAEKRVNDLAERSGGRTLPGGWNLSGVLAFRC